MKRYDPRKPVISVHVPKCAGTSFARVLEYWFGERLLKHYPNEIENRPPTRHRIRKGLFFSQPRPGICIHGHFNRTRSYGVSDYYPEVDQLFAIIRDPFELHLSTYFYVKREAQVGRGGGYRSGRPHPIIENGWSVDDFLEHSPRSYIADFFPGHMNAENAKEVISEKFIFLGLAERLQESVDHLATVLGFSSTEIPCENRSNRDQEVSSGLREKFQEENTLAYTIYKCAIEMVSGVTSR